MTMQYMLFGSGFLLSLACILNVGISKASPLHDFCWIVGCAVGAFMMYFAIKGGAA